MTRIPAAFCGALLAVGTMTPRAGAQTRPVPAGRMAVTVAVTDSTNFGQAIVILRRPNADPPNVILMSRAAATPQHLAAAAATLSVIMQRDGDRPSVAGLFRVRADAGAPAGAIGAARHALAHLDSSGQTRVGVEGVGPARITRIYLPDHSARARLMHEGRMRLRRQRPAGGGR